MLSYQLDYNKKIKYVFYESISHVETKYYKNIQKSFINCYIINDIDILNDDYNFKNYIKEPVMLIFKDGICTGFLVFKYKNSLNAVDCAIYLITNSTINDLKDVVLTSIPIYFHISKDLYDKIYMYYFDVAYLEVYNWYKSLIPNCKIKKIRDYYYICYGYTNKKHIEDTILKGFNIIVKHHSTNQ